MPFTMYLEIDRPAGSGPKITIKSGELSHERVMTPCTSDDEARCRGVIDALVVAEALGVRKCSLIVDDIERFNDVSGMCSKAGTLMNQAARYARACRVSMVIWNGSDDRGVQLG